MPVRSGRPRGATKPVETESPASEHASGTQRVQQSRLKARVLVVDDDALVAEGMRRQLTRAGYSPVIVRDPYAALNAVIEESFDVVVSDISMPGIDGIRLLQLIREHDVRLPVVLFTGAPEVATAVSALEHGAFHYLIKPSPINDVLNVIDRAVRSHELARVRDDLGVIVCRQGGTPTPKDVVTQLQRALSTSWLAYQPIVRSRDGSLFGYEAFVRTDEPEFPDPRNLIDAAVASQRLTTLGRVVRSRALRFLETEESSTYSVFVNVHRSDLSDPLLVASSSPVARHAKRMVLEIADPSALQQASALKEQTSLLRSMGYRIAVDDVGQGYSALNGFALLEPDVVKIDMSLVRDIDATPTKQKLVRSLARLCRELGTTLVAKGVETGKEEAQLKELGCDLLQGYLYGPPTTLGL